MATGTLSQMEAEFVSDEEDDLESERQRFRKFCPGTLDSLAASDQNQPVTTCTAEESGTVAAAIDVLPSTSSEVTLSYAPRQTNRAAAGGQLSINKMRQEKNPLLRFVRNVPRSWSDTKADFEFGGGACALYLSLKYHRLHPQYLDTRLKEVGSAYDLRILLCVVNVDEPKHLLRELNLCCLRLRWTLILSYSVEEAAEYLESFVSHQHRPIPCPDAVTSSSKPSTSSTVVDVDAVGKGGRVRDADLEKAISLLASVRSVNKTDAERLIGVFGSLKRVIEASAEELCICPGLGPLKAQRLYDTFRDPLFV